MRKVLNYIDAKTYIDNLPFALYELKDCKLIKISKEVFYHFDENYLSEAIFLSENIDNEKWINTFTKEQIKYGHILDTFEEKIDLLNISNNMLEEECLKHIEYVDNLTYKLKNNT